MLIAAPPTLLEPGHNCYRATSARRAALLIDGEAYFSAFARAALRARDSIIIVGWDFHSQTRLHLDAPGVPDLLGDFLNFLVGRNSGLRIFILTWDCPLVFAKGREPPVTSVGGWQPHARIAVHVDGNCPLRASIHQKMVVIDGTVAFCGGMDLTVGRWDTPAHEWCDPRRTNPGETEPYAPVHDVMLIVDSGAARALHRIATDRWREATGEGLPAAFTDGDPWPESVVALLANVTVGVARTVPAWDGRQAVAEVEALYLDMIAAAKRFIYIENQYFSATSLGEALAARLAEPNGPEVVVVLRLASSGRFEEPTMTALRSELLRKLREADSHGRFSAWYPDTPGRPCCDVHSKLMIVDDEWLRVGSANFANRSMGLDTECDLVLEAGGEPARRAGIAAARNRLLGEHLGIAPQHVMDAYALSGSLRTAIGALAGKSARTLRPFEHLDAPSAAVLALATGIADPQCRRLDSDELPELSSADPSLASASPGP